MGALVIVVFDLFFFSILETKRCSPEMMPQPIKASTVYLAGLPACATESDLRAFFGQYGNVREVVITNDEHEQRPTGFGYVSFDDEATVDRVTANRFVTLNDKRMMVKRDVPLESARCGVCMQPTTSARLTKFMAEFPVAFSAPLNDSGDGLVPTVESSKIEG